MYDIDTIKEVFQHFFPNENIWRLEQQQSGTVNKTYKVFTTLGNYIIQEISNSVFGKNINKLAYNYNIFINEYNKHGEAGTGFNIPLWIPDKCGRTIFTDTAQRHWRVYKYLSGRPFDIISAPNRIKMFATAVSSMHFLLSNVLDNPQEVIPYYHDICYYINDFRAVLAVKKRDSVCERIIDENMPFILEKCIFKKNSIIHGDTKIGNILYDSVENKISFIDLDTFFYSSKLIDIGDSIRSIANKAGDIPENIDAIGFDSRACMEFLETYLSSPLCKLNATEILQLPYAIMRIPFELGVRFYTDYLKGDIYFVTTYHDQNLRRAKCQFKLYQDIKASKIISLTNNLLKD